MGAAVHRGRGVARCRCSLICPGASSRVCDLAGPTTPSSACTLPSPAGRAAEPLAPRPCPRPAPTVPTCMRLQVHLGLLEGRVTHVVWPPWRWGEVARWYPADKLIVEDTGPGHGGK